ncbi:MAG: DUF998 domain-containing protein [Candidatus Methanosuratincola petrocarbonis]
MAVASLYIAILISISISPWFNWLENALSDLGNLRNQSAPFFNGGLLISGLLIITYSIKGFRIKAPLTAKFLALTGFSLQLVGVFCENYGRIHFYVSLMLFLFLLLTGLAYFFETKNYLALLILLAIPIWWLYFNDVIFHGAAVPEMISSLLTLPWLFAAFIESERSSNIDSRH